MGEQIRLNETQKEQWNEVRGAAINVLMEKLNYKPNEVWQRAVIFKGISRLVDERFNTASRKLIAIEKGYAFVVTEIEKTGYPTSQKSELVNEILASSDLFTEQMLLKLSTKELQELKEKVIG